MSSSIHVPRDPSIPRVFWPKPHKVYNSAPSEGSIQFVFLLEWKPDMELENNLDWWKEKVNRITTFFKEERGIYIDCELYFDIFLNIAPELCIIAIQYSRVVGITITIF